MHFSLHPATPQITIPSQQESDLKLLVGDSCILTCMIAGIPTPTVTWYHDNVELHSGRKISITRVSPSMATLNISSLTVDDTGIYQCFAGNVVGRTQRSLSLQVRTPGKTLPIYLHTQASTHAIPALPPSLSAIPDVSASSSEGLIVDSIIGKPLLVAPSDGGHVTLFAVVTADPCPTTEWRLNGSAVSNGGNYIIGDPCSSAPAGTTTFNFTLTITANSATTGIYDATLTNAAGTREVPDVFVTPPGILARLILMKRTALLVGSCSLQFRWSSLSSRFPPALPAC